MKPLEYGKKAGKKPDYSKIKDYDYNLTLGTCQTHDYKTLRLVSGASLLQNSFVESLEYGDSVQQISQTTILTR